MRTEKKRLTIILGIIVLLLLCAIVPAFALLIHDTNIDFNTEFGDIPADATQFSAQSHQTFIFTRAGEKFDLNLKVSNKSDAPMRYNYQIKVDDNSQGLENAIFVYMDDVFVATLSQGKNGVINIENDNYFINAKNGEELDIAKHKLSFELHNGADGSVYQNKQFSVTVTLLAGSINYQKNIVASNLEEFKKALDDVKFSVAIPTIRLANDIALDADLTVYNACNIDLMGHNLTFNGNMLNFAFLKNGVAQVYSSRGVVNNGSTSGIKMNSDETALKFGNGAESFSSAVAITAFDKQTAVDLLIESIKNSMGVGVKAGESLTLAKGLAHYISSGKISLTKQYGNFTLSGVNVATASNQRTSVCAIAVSEQSLEFKVLGQDADGYLAIVQQKLGYLSDLTIDKNDREVDFDLYLPTKLEDINASIVWQSLNQNILSDKGICGDSVEGIATLIATIDINGARLVMDFTFSILKQTNQMRFDYLVARIGEQNLSALYDTSMPEGSYFVLPIVQQGNAEDYRAMYNLRSLGLDSLSYELSPTFNYLSTLGVANRVHLIEPTLETYAEILIKGRFSNERDKEYISTIGIQIKTLDNTKLHQQILDYLQTLLNDVDILQNVLDTRAQLGMANEVGDFIMPSEYKGFDITYSSLSPLFKGIEYIPATDFVEARAVFRLDLSKLSAKQGAEIIQASIKIKNADENSLNTQSPLKVVTPPAIVNDADGIDDINLLNSVNLQTIQQLVDTNNVLQKGVPTIGVNASDDASLLKGYILLRDAQYLKTLIIKTGDLEYANALSKHDYDASSKLYFYSVNSFLKVYSGLGLLNNLTTVKINNHAEMFKGAQTQKAELANALLDMISSEYLKLEHLEITNAYLTRATQTLRLNNLTYLDISNNASLENMDFLCERGNNILQYLDISGTAYNYTRDFGVLVALYYRHTSLGGATAPQYYYSDGSARVLYQNTHSQSALEAYFYIYNLAYGKDTITSVAMQLKWDITTKTLGKLKITWTLDGALNHAGLPIGVIVSDTALSKVKLTNNILATAKPTDARAYENCNLKAELTFVDAQTMAQQTIGRTFRLKLAY